MLHLEHHFQRKRLVYKCQCLTPVPMLNGKQRIVSSVVVNGMFLYWSESDVFTILTPFQVFIDIFTFCNSVKPVCLDHRLVLSTGSWAMGWSLTVFK